MTPPASPWLAGGGLSCGRTLLPARVLRHHLGNRHPGGHLRAGFLQHLPLMLLSDLRQYLGHTPSGLALLGLLLTAPVQVHQRAVHHRIPLADRLVVLQPKIGQTQLQFRQPIIDFLESEQIQKAGVGIRDDLHALRKLTHFSPAGFTELASMARQSGLEVESVKKLTALLLGFRISKGAQTSNWEATTLTKKQIEYAATDAWVCLEIYKKLTAVSK